MSYAPQVTLSDGSTATYAVPFPYMDPSHIHVNVNRVAYTGTISFDAPSIIRLNPVPTAGSVIAVYRVTPVDTPVTSFQGGTLASFDLNNNETQALFALQESEEELQRAVVAPQGEAPQPLPSRSELKGKVLGGDPSTGQLQAIDAAFTPDATNSFASVAQALLGSVATAAFLTVAGWTLGGDGGNATYIQVSSTATGFQTADGKSWEVSSVEVGTRQFGIFPSSTADQVRVRMQRAADFIDGKGGGKIVVEDPNLAFNFTGTDPFRIGVAIGNNSAIVRKFPGCGFKVANDAGNYLAMFTGKTGSTSNTLISVDTDQNPVGNTTQDVKVGGNGPALVAYFNATANKVHYCNFYNACGINTVSINGGTMSRGEIVGCRGWFVPCPYTSSPNGRYDNSMYYMDGDNSLHTDNIAYNSGAYYSAVTGHEIHGSNNVIARNGAVGYNLVCNIVGQNLPNAANGFRPVASNAAVLHEDNWGIDCLSGSQFWAITHLKGLTTRRNTYKLNPSLYPTTISDAVFGHALALSTGAVGDFEIDSSDNTVEYTGPVWVSATAYTGSAGFEYDSFGSIVLRQHNDVVKNGPAIGISIFPGSGFTNVWPAWSSATAYQVPQRVTSGGIYYECILANTNQVPPNATYWSVPQVPAPAWSSAVNYVPGDRVAVSTVSYQCILAHINHTPPNATYWTALPQTRAYVEIDDPTTVNCGTNTSAVIRRHGIPRGLVDGYIRGAKVVDTGGAALKGGPQGWDFQFINALSKVTFENPRTTATNGATWPTSGPFPAATRARPQRTLIEGAQVALTVSDFIQDYHLDITSATGRQFLIEGGLTSPVPPGFRIRLSISAVGVTATITFSGSFLVSTPPSPTTGQTSYVELEWIGASQWKQVSPWLTY